MSTVRLLRHGAHDDVGHRLTGRSTDRGLTTDGRRQVERAIAALERMPPTRIVSSPRRRTLETAAMVGIHFGLEVETAAALDEIDFGEWTGHSFAELDRDPRWTQWNARRASTRCPGGESQREAQVRALAFAFEVAAHHDQVLLVTHCDIIRALVCWSQQRSLDDIHAVSCDPGSLTVLDLVEARAAA